MPSFFILDSSVVGFIPKISAAPQVIDLFKGKEVFERKRDKH